MIMIDESNPSHATRYTNTISRIEPNPNEKMISPSGSAVGYNNFCILRPLIIITSSRRRRISSSIMVHQTTMENRLWHSVLERI